MGFKNKPIDDKNKKINNPDKKEEIKKEEQLIPNQEQPKEKMPQTVGDAVSEDTKSIIDVTLEADEPQGFNTKLDEIKDKSKYIGRTTEKGFVNEEYGSSMALRENGQISLAAGKQAQIKMNPSGTVDTIGLETVTTSNRVKFFTDEMVINNHKLNPNLYEFTGFKTVPLQDNQFATVGNFTMAGYVLVRAWDRQLGRYMMIRRPARIAPFGPKLNVPDINSALKIDDPLQVKEDILALSKKGYQVNAKIEDKASRIGKEGLKRDDAKYGRYGADKDGGSGIGSSSGHGPITASTRQVSIGNIQVGDQLMDAAKATAKLSGISLDFILAQFIHESGKENDPNGNYNYGNVRWDAGSGMTSTGFGFYTNAQQCAEAFTNHTIVYEQYGQELVNASQNNDPQKYYELMKAGGYFIDSDDEGGAYAKGFIDALREVQGQ